MAVTLNAKGTSVPYFKIGKSGVTLFQGSNDPHISEGYSVKTNDIWFDTDARTLKFRKSDNTWQALAEADKVSELLDVDLTGLADGYFLRYSSSSSKWEAHEVTGGLASDWGSITETPISYDGYTGDVWQLNTSTNTLSHNGNVSVDGNFSVSGTTTFVDVENINVTNSFKFEGSTANDYELVLQVEDPTADRTITLPDTSGTVALLDNSYNTGAMIMPVGTTAQRPSTAAEGMVRFNSETKRFEGYNGTEWLNIDIVDNWGTLDGSSTSSGTTYNYDFSNLDHFQTFTVDQTSTGTNGAVQLAGAAISSDGVYWFTVDPSQDKIFRFKMATAWDVSTVESTYQTFSITLQEGAARGVTLNDDGTSIYVTGTISDKVHQYDMTTAYDLSTASHASSPTLNVYSRNPFDVRFKSDGTKMYVAGQQYDNITEYTLSTAWDISTLTYVGATSVVDNPVGLEFNNDGTKMFVAVNTAATASTAAIAKYELSTAWDTSTIGTAVTTSLVNVGTGPSALLPYGIAFDSTGDTLYITDSNGDKLHQFSLD